MVISSPVRTKAIGPPEAASGETCPMDSPEDRSRTAQFEHTLVVTEDGADVLTTV